MSDDRAYQDDMGLFSRPNDRELDRLLEGREPSGDDELALFVGELAQTFRAPPGAATQSRHLSAIMDAVAQASPVALGASMRHRRQRGRWTGRLVLAGAVVLGLFCGVAYAGAFPGRVQGAIADVAHNVGVSLPGAHHNKNDGAQNDTHNGRPSLPSVTTPAPSNRPVRPTTHVSPRQHDGAQGERDGLQQQQQSGGGNGQNQGGGGRSGGTSGNNGSGNSGQGAHGDTGSGQSGGGGQQGGGQQGDGDH